MPETCSEDAKTAASNLDQVIHAPPARHLWLSLSGHEKIADGRGRCCAKSQNKVNNTNHTTIAGAGRPVRKFCRGHRVLPDPREHLCARFQHAQQRALEELLRDCAPPHAELCELDAG